MVRFRSRLSLVRCCAIVAEVAATKYESFVWAEVLNRTSGVDGKISNRCRVNSMARLSKVTIQKPKRQSRFGEDNFRRGLLQLWAKLKEAVLVKSKKQSKAFFESSTIHCYQYVVDSTLKKWESRMWRVLHLVAISVAVWIMWVAGGQAILTPVAVSRTPVGAPVTSVPHPALAFCSLNRISKWRVTGLAEELIERKSLNYTLDVLVDLLGYLGMAYTLETPDSDQLELLHGILEPYNLDHLLRMLTPSCDDFVSKCQWRGAIVNCSSILVMRKTMEGYCCMFNYRREADTFLSNVNSTTAPLSAMPALERGLSILINPRLEDYFFTRYPHEGTKVIIFNPDDYPDIISGSCVQQSLPPTTEVYVNVDAILTTATESVRELAVDTRQCLLTTDKTAFLDTFSDCVVSCRMRSITAACSCIPFYLPAQYEGHICNLLDNVCLKKWREDWWNAWSGEEALLNAGEVAGDIMAPPCAFCLPSCEEAVYRIKQHTVALQPDTINSQPDSDKSLLKKGVIFKNHTVVHIYFSKDTVVHLEHGLLSKWYDLLSTMGGICGLVIGGSIISIVEFFYFVFGGPVTRSKHRLKAEMRQLYWEELRNYKRL